MWLAQPGVKNGLQVRSRTVHLLAERHPVELIESGAEFWRMAQLDSAKGIDGACHCGYIRVEGDADPEKTAVCHCTDCQVGNGSAFRVNVPVPGATFRITGQPATYLKTTAESGNPRLQAFCPRCGSPIYSTSPGEGQQASYMVRVGILRQRPDFVPRRQNWFRSALPWVSSLATLHRNEKQA
jgi:hypothetical protein